MTHIRHRSRAFVVAALVLIAGCKRCGGETQIATATAVEVDAGEIAVDASVPSGDLLGPEGFVFDLAVYHFAPPPANADGEVRRMFAAAGIEVRSTPLTQVPTVSTVIMMRPSLAEFAPPSMETLRYLSRGLSESEKTSLQAAAAVTALSFAGPAKDAAVTYRLALKAALVLEKAAPGVLWDEDTREAFGRASWAERLNDWSGDEPPLSRQVTIHAYQDGELLRLVTLGMRKFALPDVSVNQVAIHESKPMGTLVNLVCQTLFERGALTRAGELDVSVSHLTNAKMRSEIENDMAGGTGTGTVHLEIAALQKGDSENRLIEVVFPGPVSKLQERQVSAVTSILGAKDDLVAARHDTALLAASARARAKALTLKPKFASGAPQLEQLMVKGPFKTASGGNEWMWIEVVRWKGSKIEGILENDPFQVPNLKAGARVEVEEDSIFDYIYRHADGTREGNETSALIEGQGNPKP